MNRLATLFWLAVASILVAVIIWAILPVYMEKVRLERKLANLHEAQRKQEMIFLNLRKEEALLQENDPVYLEKFVRDDFGWCREGEIIYKFNGKGEKKSP